MLSNDARNMIEMMVQAGKSNSLISRELGLTIGQVCGVRYRMKKPKANGHANGHAKSLTQAERMRQLWINKREAMMVGPRKAGEKAKWRAKLRKKAKASWADPEIRARRLAGMRGVETTAPVIAKPSFFRRIASVLGL